MVLKYVTSSGYSLVKPNDGDAGYDIPLSEDVTIPNGKIVHHNTKIQIEIPEGYVGILHNKSSIAGGNKAKGFIGGILVMGGVIDSSYRGEIIVPLMNMSNQYQSFKAGQKICQLIIFPIITPEIEQVDLSDLEETERGNGGFGSTGKF